MDPVLIGTLPDTAAIVSCWRAEKQKDFKASYPNELPNNDNLLYLYTGMSQQISRLGVLPFYPIQIISCKQMLSDSLNKVEPETDQTVQLVYSRLLSPTEPSYILTSLNANQELAFS